MPRGDIPVYRHPVWVWNKANGGSSPTLTGPMAGPHDTELPLGRHPMQLYSLATPNGVKVTVMLEELLALGHSGCRVRRMAHPGINQGDQFGSGFVGVNPNSKIPALLDRSGPQPIGCSGPAPSCCTWRRNSAPSCPRSNRPGPSASWLFWQMGSAPTWAAASGTFMPMRRQRSNTPSTASPWAKRQMDVLNRRLAETLPGRRYTGRHGRMALVRRAREGPDLRSRRVPAGA